MSDNTYTRNRYRIFKEDTSIPNVKFGVLCQEGNWKDVEEVCIVEDQEVADAHHQLRSASDITLPVFLIDEANKRVLVQRFERTYVHWIQALEKEFLKNHSRAPSRLEWIKFLVPYLKQFLRLLCPMLAKINHGNLRMGIAMPRDDKMLFFNMRDPNAGSRRRPDRKELVMLLWAFINRQNLEERLWTDKHFSQAFGAASYLQESGLGDEITDFGSRLLKYNKKFMSRALLFSDPTFRNGDYRSFFMTRMFSFFVKQRRHWAYEREACFKWEWRTDVCKDPALQHVFNIPGYAFSGVEQYKEGLDYVRFWKNASEHYPDGHPRSGKPEKIEEQLNDEFGMARRLFHQIFQFLHLENPTTDQQVLQQELKGYLTDVLPQYESCKLFFLGSFWYDV